ncbi:MAG TPA: hypothetical protein VHL30_04385, partial [Chlamydiales bacterium]|nr:hypothetical protein [Chlamydiales bacterium]
MIIFKALFLIGVLQAELPAEVSSNGWVAVERSEKEDSPLGADESDPTIWVVFAKQMGSEKILVSFPVEPVYKYTKADGSAIEISASAGGNEHLVLVSAPSRDVLNERKANLESAIIVLEKVGEERAELIYWQSGYWYMEQLISTAEHSY